MIWKLNSNDMNLKIYKTCIYQINFIKFKFNK